MFTTMGPAFVRQPAKREEGTGERCVQSDRGRYSRCTTVIQIAFIPVLQSDTFLLCKYVRDVTAINY